MQGYTGSFTYCEKCEPGTYKDFVSNETREACLQCPSNTYSHEASVQLTDCICNAGYTGADGTACIGCEVGKFKDVNGSAACTNCFENTYQNTTAQTVCFDCVERSTTEGLDGQDSVEDCICRVGSVRLGPVLDPHCSDCGPGEFASEDGCQNCSATSYTTGFGSTECIPCPNTSVANAQRTGCVCKAGHTCTLALKMQQDCSEVIDNMLDITTLAEVQARNRALTCPDDGDGKGTSCQITALINDPGFRCHHNVPIAWMKLEGCSASGSHISNYRQNPSFSGQGDNDAWRSAVRYQRYNWNFERPIFVSSFQIRQPCDNQNKKDNWYDATMTFKSSSDDVVASVEITCPEYDNTQTPPRCKVCGSWFHLDSAVEAQYAILQYHESSLLAYDYYYNGAQNLASGANIFAGTYDKLYLYPPLFRTNCMNEPPFECLDGDCSACSQDFFKPSVGYEGCTQCQPNAQSPIASTEEPACKCNRGFQQDGPSTCVECIAGKYSDNYDPDGLDALECTACDNYTFTPNTPADDVDHCTVCSLCGQNEYWEYGCDVPDENTNATCTACPPGLSGSVPATYDSFPQSMNPTVDSCVCLPGVYYDYDPYVWPRQQIFSLNRDKYDLYPAYDSPLTKWSRLDRLFDGALGNIAYTNSFPVANGLLQRLFAVKLDKIDFLYSVQIHFKVYSYAEFQNGICGIQIWLSVDEAHKHWSMDDPLNVDYDPGTTEYVALNIDNSPAQFIGVQDSGGNFHSCESASSIPTNTRLTYTWYLQSNQRAASVILKGSNTANNNINLVELGIQGVKYDNLNPSQWTMRSVYPACNYCRQGSFKPTHGNEPCTQCPYGTDTQPCAEQTSNCDEFSDCLCAAGFFYNDPSCQKCGEGTAKATINNLPTCTACLSNENSWNENGTMLIKGVAHCTCDPGFFREGSTCQMCLPGTLKNVGGDQACSPCPEGTYQDEYGKTACKTCQANSASTPGLHRCTCNAGFENFNGTHYNSDGVLCQSCVDGQTFKSVNSADKCAPCTELCAVGLRFEALCNPTTDLTCQDCQDANSDIPFQSLLEFCFCDAGYEFNGEVCVPCQAGEARADIDNNTIMCVDCVPGQTFSSQEAQSECSQCHADCGKIDRDGDENEHYVQFVTNECTVTSQIVCEDCQLCPAGQYESVSCGSDNDRRDTVCSPCPSNFYCPGGEVRNPQPCDAFSGSLENSTSLSDCTCRDGYHAECDFMPPHVTVDGNNIFIGTSHNGDGNGKLLLKQFCCGVLKNSNQNSYFKNLVNLYPGIPTTFNYHVHFPSTSCGSTDRDLTKPCRNANDRYEFPFFVLMPDGVLTDMVIWKVEWIHTYNWKMTPTTGSLTPSNYMGARFFATSPFDCEYCRGCHAGNLLDAAPYNPDTFVIPPCQPCGFNAYCSENRQYQCPNHSLTHGALSSHILDCQCRRGHHRVFNDDESSFTCPRCESGDWCFNNSAYNCSDDRMLTYHPSFSRFNCTCEDGWYNDVTDTECLPCPEDSYCNGGIRYFCPDEKWTRNQINQVELADCVCRPGLYTNNTNVSDYVCVACEDNTYCEGDNSRRYCSENSVSNVTSENPDDCLCLPGFRKDKSTQPFTCVPCVVGETYSLIVGGNTCEECSSCNEGITYEYASCLANRDRRCVPCTNCDDFPELYESEQCTLLHNTVCSNCTVCDFSTQYESLACGSIDTQCVNIVFNATDCADNQYRGQHTRSSQSKCLPCASLHKPYFGMQLHKYVGGTRPYDDPLGCDIECLGASKRRDSTNSSLGCESCETGNFLYKNLAMFDPSNPNECVFTCKEPAILQNNDCVLPSLLQRNVLYIEIVSIQHVDNSLLKMTIRHSNYSHYVVLVGPDHPTCKSSVWGSECCYDHLWRISANRTIGDQRSHALQHCGKTRLLDSQASSTTQNTIELFLHHKDLVDVATCNTEKIDGRVARHCKLAVSIVNIHSFNTAYKNVHITLFETESVVVESNVRYIPLNFVLFQITPLYQESGTTVFSVIMNLQNIDRDVRVDMYLSGMSPVDAHIVQNKEDCRRFSAQNTSLHSSSYSIAAGATLHTQTYWRSSKPNTLYEMIRAFVTVIPEQELDAMKIAATHNVSLTTFACAQAPQHMTTQDRVARIMVARGLGQYAVNHLITLNATLSPYVPNSIVGGHGNLLSVFAVAQSNFDHKIVFDQIFVVYTTDNSWLQIHLLSVMSTSVVDFSSEFREACLLNSDKCAYEYALSNPYAKNFVRVDCANKQASKDWLQLSFKAFEDHGHVDTVCDKMNKFSQATAAIMLHTEQNFHASRFKDKTITTYLWARVEVQ